MVRFLTTQTLALGLLVAPLFGGNDKNFTYLALGDRKSTRLNSSHLGISYAVFCLKKNVEDVPLMLLGPDPGFLRAESGGFPPRPPRHPPPSPAGHPRYPPREGGPGCPSFFKAELDPGFSPLPPQPLVHR